MMHDFPNLTLNTACGHIQFISQTHCLPITKTNPLMSFQIIKRRLCENGTKATNTNKNVHNCLTFKLVVHTSTSTLKSIKIRHGHFLITQVCLCTKTVCLCHLKLTVTMLKSRRLQQVVHVARNEKARLYLILVGKRIRKHLSQPRLLQDNRAVSY